MGKGRQVKKTQVRKEGGKVKVEKGKQRTVRQAWVGRVKGSSGKKRLGKDRQI